VLCEVCSHWAGPLYPAEGHHPRCPFSPALSPRPDGSCHCGATAVSTDPDGCLFCGGYTRAQLDMMSEG
jgi:hypothetical protein